MILKGGSDLLHIYLSLGVAVLHIFNLAALFLEKAKKAFLLLSSIKIAKLAYHLGDQLSNLTQILCPYIFKSCIGKISHFLLGSGTVLEDLVSILNVNFLSKAVYHLLFFRGENGLFHFLFHSFGFRLCCNLCLWLSQIRF